jgi:hypothetical protein
MSQNHKCGAGFSLRVLSLQALNPQAEEAAEKVVYFVIPSEARNLSSV